MLRGLACGGDAFAASASDETVFAERRDRERRTREYLRSVQDGYRRDCCPPTSRCEATKSRIAAATEGLMGHRGLGEYIAAHGCTRATPDAISLVAARTRRVVELGAGNGHWVAALRAAGVNARGFDDFSALPADRMVAAVERGSPEVLSSTRGDLLLVYPEPGPFALDCLNRFKLGDLVIYVGEPRGGANASPDFFDCLARDFELLDQIDLDPFPGGRERLYILRRRRQLQLQLHSTPRWW